MRTLLGIVAVIILTATSLAQNVPSISPIQNFKGATAEFGPRMHPVLQVQRDHQGLDFFVPAGTPVLATADGKVIQADTVGNFGIVIRIENSRSIRTFFAHLADFTVQAGQRVQKGEFIGHSGNTGLSSGPHLHYEVIQAGKCRNPRDFIAQK